MQTHFSLRDASRVLKLKPYQIDHALAVGAVPEPRLRVSNRRVFQREDLKRLAVHFGVALEPTQGTAESKAAGASL